MLLHRSRLYLSDTTHNASTLTASVNRTGNLAADLRSNFTGGDCLPAVGVDYNVQKHWYVHQYTHTHGSHLRDRTWTSFGCASLCAKDYSFHYKVGDPPLACAFTGFGLDVCTADPIWLQPGDDNKAIPTQATCAAVATRSTAVPPLTAGTQFCAACFGNSPYCYVRYRCERAVCGIRVD